MLHLWNNPFIDLINTNFHTDFIENYQRKTFSKEFIKLINLHYITFINSFSFRKDDKSRKNVQYGTFLT